MESLLRLPEVEARTGLKRSAIYKRIEAGRFPPPVKLTPRAVAWPASEIGGWIEKTIRESRRAS